MGYDDHGRCPMLVDERCSIYEDRPQTCRDYDCRIFSATGIAMDRQAQPDIAKGVTAWAFRFESGQSRREEAVLKQTATFLQDQRHLFPPGTLPNNPGELAALAVRICRPFAARAGAPDAEIAGTILAWRR